MNDVLVVIISYKNEHILNQCLSSLVDQSYQNFDAIVWDNGSHCAALKDKYDSLRLDFHLSEENILWSPAVNMAIKKSIKESHKYILVMNNDIILPTCAIERLVDLYKLDLDNPGIIAPAGASLGGLQDYVSHKIIPSHNNWSTDLQDEIKDYPIDRATYVTGAVLMISRDLYDRIGGLDSSMPLGADDFDYCIRAKEAGFSIWVTYSIYVNHLGHSTKDSSNWDKYGDISWKKFNEKYDGYFVSEEEAIRSFWGAKYDPDFPIGTGISLDEKIKRGIINVS